MRKIVLNVMLFLITTSVLLGIGEVFIRIISSVSNIYNIEMVKYAKQLKTSDPSGYMSHTHKKDASAMLMGVEIKLNNLGNRGEYLEVEKDKNTKRILVLGSSITMGWGVPYDSLFTTLIEESLNSEKPRADSAHYVLVNAGIGNYNSNYQYRRFLEQYPAVDPDAVVLHYFINDAEPNPKRNESYILKNSLLAAYFYDKISLMNILFLKKTDLSNYYNELYVDNNPDLKAAQQSILKIRDKCTELEIPFILMIVPDFHDLAANSPFKKYYEKVESIMVDNGIDVINSFPIFHEEFGGNEKELWIQRDDPHPNSTGHKLMAEILYKHLKNKIFVW